MRGGRRSTEQIPKLLFAQSVVSPQPEVVADGLLKGIHGLRERRESTHRWPQLVTSAADHLLGAWDDLDVVALNRATSGALHQPRVRVGCG